MDLNKLTGLFSDVDIVFNNDNVSVVTSLELDQNSNSKRSTLDLPREISQLLVDIDVMDSSELATEYIRAKEEGRNTNNLVIHRRISRFTKAFDKIFSDLKFDSVVNNGEAKSILFDKNGEKIPLDKLSSGEKQIVYRGAFLLKDVNATNGAMVFIDEPEISMHPVWQKKIMDFYKSIFTDEDGKQTSQIFVATHSPFILHNDNRYNDKVIVLKRDEKGDIVEEDKPEYYSCDRVEAIEDAFSLSDFSVNRNVVYVEGKTDEKYLNRAKTLFNGDYSFDVKCIGKETREGSIGSGSGSLENAFKFLITQKWPYSIILLYDCDTGVKDEKVGDVYKHRIQLFSNSVYDRGIENALVLDETFEKEKYIRNKTVNKPYGLTDTIQEFDKVKLCDDICSLPDEKLLIVFRNVKTVLDDIKQLFDKE